MVEQQQFTANDNTAQKTSTAGDSGLTGQNRMELYQDYNKAVGNNSTHEKSQNEQSLKDGKNDKDFPQMDDIYQKTTSGGGNNGERNLNSNQQPEGKDQQGTEKPQDPGRTDKPQDPGRNDSPNDRTQQDKEKPQDGNQQRNDAQDGRAQGADGPPREFNGRQDPYTKEALEGKATTDSNGKTESHGDAAERKSEGEKPGSSRDDTQNPPVNRDDTNRGANGLENGQGNAQRQGTEVREDGDSAQRQGNADAQRQNAATDKPTRGLNSESRLGEQRSDSQNNLSDLSKQNAQQSMTAVEHEDVDNAEKPDSPNQRSDHNQRPDQNERSERPAQRHDGRDNVEAELSKRSGNQASASETVEEPEKPGSPNQMEPKAPGKDEANPGRPNSPDQRFDPRNDLSHLSRRNAEQMMTGKETVVENDKPNSPDQRSDAQDGRREGNGADSQRQRSTRGINVESGNTASPEQRQEAAEGQGTGSRGSAVIIERGKHDAEPTFAPDTVPKQFESGTRQSAFGNGSNTSFFNKDDNGQLKPDQAKPDVVSQREQARQAKGFVHAGPPQQNDNPDSPRGPINQKLRRGN